MHDFFHQQYCCRNLWQFFFPNINIYLKTINQKKYPLVPVQKETHSSHICEFSQPKISSCCSGWGLLRSPFKKPIRQKNHPLVISNLGTLQTFQRPKTVGTIVSTHHRILKMSLWLRFVCSEVGKIYIKSPNGGETWWFEMVEKQNLKKSQLKQTQVEVQPTKQAVAGPDWMIPWISRG